MQQIIKSYEEIFLALGNKCALFIADDESFSTWGKNFIDKQPILSSLLKFINNRLQFESVYCRFKLSSALCNYQF